MHETPYYRQRTNVGRATTIRAAATAKDQNTMLSKPGQTIVAFLRPADRYQMLNACARLQQARPSFRSFASNLHLTITGVLARNQPDDLTNKQRKQVERAILEVMQKELAETPQFSVTLQGIEPGGDAKCPSGNVVAVAAPASCRYIQMLGARLREKLNPLLVKIHPGLEAEPASGVKITLGYFDEPEDFRVDRELALALEELCHVETELWVERLSLVRFRRKSFEEAEIVHEVQLPLPADPPIRQATARPKVLTVPLWAHWRGFSYLWDNPGSSLCRHADTGLWRVACEPSTDPELALYHALNDMLAEAGLDSAVNPYSFCPLPSTSYHVTVWDGINEANLSLLSEPEREKFADFLLGLPRSAKRTPPNLIPPDAFDGIAGSGPVQFRFDRLTIWGDAVLVARLTPVGEASASVLKQVIEKRKQLDALFAPMGRAQSLDYTPHISLGYFTHPRGAHVAAADLPQWECILRHWNSGQLLKLHTISAYGFESMETFLKLEFA